MRLRPVGLILTVVIAGPAAAGAGARVRIKPSGSLPTLVRIKQTIILTGAVRTAPRGTRAALEARSGGAWSVIVSAKLGRHGAYTLTWMVGPNTPVGPVSLRIAAVKARKTLATTKPVASAVGPADASCAAPSQPNHVPAGDGWIEGGVYNVGGAFPGIHACVGQAYTITASATSSGQAAAVQKVAGGHSYTLVVPAGQYNLTSGACHGTATVTAGKLTKADADCLVP